MKKQILEKTYEVSQKTKMVLDCKMMNERLYDAIYDIVNEDCSGTLTIPRDVKDAVGKIQNILHSNHYGFFIARYISSVYNDVEIVDELIREG